MRIGNLQTMRYCGTEKMTAPEVTTGTWIKIKSIEMGFGIDGYVFSVNSPTKLSVGYLQNGIKAIKEDVVWNGSNWEFEHDGPCGSYLDGSDEVIVRRGPIP